MGWYRPVKIAASYTMLLLSDIRQSGVFKNCRFSSTFANGTFGIFEYADGNVYEIRVQNPNYIENDRTSSSVGLGKSVEILERLKSTGLFKSAIQSQGNNKSVSMLVQYQPDSLRYREVLPVDKYIVTVMDYRNSKHRNYFIDTKASESEGNDMEMWEPGRSGSMATE